MAFRFSSELGIPVRIELFELESIGLTSDNTVSGSVNDMKAWVALDYFLRGLECATVIRQEGLEITTRDAIETEPMLRVYLYFLAGTGFHRSILSPLIL